MSFGNTSGQVAVELRLVMDQLRKDIKSAGEMLRSSLGGSMDQAGSGVDKVTKKVGDLEKQTRKTKGAFDDLKRGMDDAWRKAMDVPSSPTIRDSSGSTAKGLFGGPGAIIPMTGAYGLASSAFAAVAAGGSGAVPPRRPTLPPGFRSIMGPPVGITGGGGGGGGAGGGGGGGGGFLGGGGGLLGTLAQVGAALAGLRVAIGFVKYAFDMLLAPLRAIFAAADAARKANASSILSGKPTGYGIAASSIGSVLGVSAEDIMMFGEALKSVSDKVRYSTQTFQETNAVMTPLGWNVQALKQSFAALWAQLGAYLAPALNQIVNLLRNTTDALTRSGLVEALAWLVKIFMHVGTVLLGFVSIIAQAFELILQAFTDGIQYFVRQVKNSIARWFGGRIDSTDTFKETKDKADILARTIRDLLSRSANNESAPQSGGSSRRLAASAWERMGLIVGTSPGMDAARETARNTRKMVWILEQIMGGGANGAPRGGFGSTPMMSAP
jgi:hypothetical protein